MSVQTQAFGTRRSHGRLYVTAGVVAAVAVIVGWVVAGGALDTSPPTRQNATVGNGITSAAIPATGYLSAIAGAPAPSVTADASLSSAAQEAQGPAWLMNLTPAELAAGVLGSSYALPSRGSGPTLSSVLASMSPETRRYTQRLMGLTFAQLAAGAAGSP